MTKHSSKIAIVGMSGRFPGADSVASLWQSLSAGKELIRHFTESQLLKCGVDRSILRDPSYVRARPMMDQVCEFDANFFGMSPHEAEATDPQLRLLLECVWEALEESGHAGAIYDGTVGVFTGLRLSRYLDEHLLANAELVKALGRDYLMMINRKDSAATWIAYRLNLTGPAISVNTACSTSLVAVHLAASSLMNFECDVAVAGGAALACFENEGYLAPPDSPWSSDGHCRAFDASASGTLEGSGCAVVALKRLDDAIAEGDIIHAVLLGSAVNNDGGKKIGYTAPGVDGQTRVIAEAMAVANVTGDDIGYVEAHGTATPLGDPLEISALSAAFRQTTSRIADCPLGSIKSNLGHLGVAAGVTGLIKAALCLKHQQIPPSLHFEAPNKLIDFDHSPFYVNTRLRDWKPSDRPRRAAVSSFGIGGTNAHVVLEEAPPPSDIFSPRRFFLLPVSAQGPVATAKGLRCLADHLERNPSLPLASVSATLRIARPAFACRRAVVAASSAMARTRLLEAVETMGESSKYDSPPRLALRFTGRGGVRAGMVRHLYAFEPLFRDAFDLCNRLVMAKRNINLCETLCQFKPGNQFQESWEGCEVADLALFAIQWALAETLHAFGVPSEVFCGIGLGELLSATRAGVFDLSDALELIAKRWQTHPSDFAGEFCKTLSRMRLREPTRPFISSFSGTWIEPLTAKDPDYWVHLWDRADNSCESLQLVASRSSIVVDVGSVVGFSEANGAAEGLSIIGRQFSADSTIADDEALLNALARLWELGVDLDWNVFGRGEKTQRVSLPTYPFVRVRHWVERSRNPSDFLESSATAWDAIVAEIPVTDETLGELKHAAERSDKPLVLVSPTLPPSVPKDFLVLMPPPNEPGNTNQIRQMVEAAMKLRYRRLLLIDTSQKILPNFVPLTTPLIHSVRNDLMSRIIRIWESTLRQSNILPTDNFFDRGGDSLVAINMISRLNSEFGVTLRPAELVSSPTISALAERIEHHILSGLDESDLEEMLTEIESSSAMELREKETKPE